MKTACFALGLISLSAAAHATTVNLAQTSVNDATGETISAVSSSEYLETGVTQSTVSAPALSGGFRFTHWTNNNEPATIYRDAWGRSLNPISFTLLEDTTFTAHYLPTTRDSDGDGVPDWYEIEYFGNLSHDATFDGDGDGIALAAELSGCTHPLYGNSSKEGGVASVDSGMVTFNRYNYPTYTLRSEPTGTVNKSDIVPSGTVVSTPELTENTFGYWTLDGVPQRDSWGVALRKISFTMGTANREAVAYFFDGDTDGDNLPDAWEQYHYGTLANDGTSDSDGDGRSLLAEYTDGTSPVYGNSSREGGVAWADSTLVTANLAGYPHYTLSSTPAGTVNKADYVPNGTVITTPEMTQSTFGYWELDGVAQRDAWGVALRQIRFTMAGTDRTAVAHLFANNSDGDGIDDSYEMYHFGTLANDASSDTDGDGISLLEEVNSGTNPLYGDTSQDGGVAWADSAQVVVNLQPYERLGKMLIGGVLTDFFSPDPGTVTGIQTGAWSTTAMSDWDGDGDLDLFVGHEDGLRVFRNIGTAHNPDFEEITSGFSGLEALIASVNRPILCGGDWNGDGLGDLVIGGTTGTLRLIASNGGFEADGVGVDFTVTSTRTSPALGDMNGDGRADLLVLLDNGSVSLFLNNGTSVPFSGGGTTNYLGTLAPQGTSISIGDLNQDGRPDVLLADSEGRIWEFIKKAAGGFTLQSKVWGGSNPGFASGLAISAVDIEGDGDVDLISGIANGGIMALRDPKVGRPTGLVAVPGADSVQLDWDANWQSRIRGYSVYRASSENGPWTQLPPDSVPLPSYLDSPLNPGVKAYYHVTGLSHYFLPGNSSPRVIETDPSDAVFAQTGKVILSVPPARGISGNMFKIGLSVENAMGVSGSGLKLKVQYDPSKLTPLTQVQPDEPTVVATGLSGNLTFTDNSASAAGELVINASDGVLEPGAGKLFNLQFKVAPGLPLGTSLPVTITSAAFRGLSGNALSVQIVPREKPKVANIFIEGDLNGDGAITDADKETLQNLLVPTAEPPAAEQLIAGDLNGDGKLDEMDLVLLMQLLATP